jgi:hypothetical protein
VANLPFAKPTSVATGRARPPMSRLAKRTRLTCIEIMDDLMRLPCAKVFLHAVDPVRDDVPTYLQVIKHPVDLGLVLKRLQNNEYQGISAWDKDMGYIWQNAEKFYQKGHLMSILANELHRHYDKEYQRVKVLRLAKWSRVVIGFRARLEALFEQIPPVIGALAAFSDKTGQALKPFSEEELNIFIRMSLYLQNPVDAKKMAQIVQHCQPELEVTGQAVELDVNDLSVQTLYCLRDFVTFRLAEMNVAYPR